jgi:hypothetical protein
MIPDKKQIILNLQNIGMQIIQDPNKVNLLLLLLLFFFFYFRSKTLDKITTAIFHRTKSNHRDAKTFHKIDANATGKPISYRGGRRTPKILWKT